MTSTNKYIQRFRDNTSIKCERTKNANAHYSFQELKASSSNCSFSLKPTDSSFIAIHDKDRQQILTFKELEPSNF